MNTATLNWKATKEDARTIAAIVTRVESLCKRVGVDYPVLDASMDLTATHLNDCPLRLTDLLNADPADFAHDVFGIRRHLNRETGTLQDCFLPRFAKKTDQ